MRSLFVYVCSLVSCPSPLPGRSLLFPPVGVVGMGVVALTVVRDGSWVPQRVWGKRGSRPAVPATCPILFRSSDAVFVIGFVSELLCIEVFNA